MILNTKELYGHKLAASDGEFGHVKDFLFDDKTWVIRYLVADTGSWLPGRLVLLSPHSFIRWDQEAKTLQVSLSRKQIEDSPSIDTHRTVSRQFEIEYYRYYGWPTYWAGGGMWGLGGFPVIVPPPVIEGIVDRVHRHRDDKHLQSMKAVTGYNAQTSGGIIGDVSGFLVNDSSWAIRDVVIETGHWYSGKSIKVSPGQIERIGYEESKVYVNISKSEAMEHHQYSGQLLKSSK
jgi:hypothetical protein